ncbi:MAG: PfkB family carbohydrate kinase [Turicibacter sp.]
MKKILTIGEIMQRLTPPNFEKLEQCTTLQVTYGGSEANIAIALANFGHDVSFATRLPHNTLGRTVKNLLHTYQINTDHVLFGGESLGIYYVEQGYSVRPSNVIYNRKHSSFATLQEDDFEIDALIDGRDYLHVSGITLALGQEVRQFTTKLMKRAYEKGLTVSLDFNYRVKLWTISEASAAIREVLPYVHICFASLYDIEVIAGYAVDDEYDSVDERRTAAFTKFLNFSNCEYIFGTVRTQTSTHQNKLKAYCYTSKGDVYQSDEYEFEIIDRVGAGDAFVAGVLNKLDKSLYNFSEATNYGIACGVMKHTINGDILLTGDEEISQFIASNGSGGIKR